VTQPVKSTDRLATRILYGLVIGLVLGLVARALCVSRGVNPDAVHADPHSEGPFDVEFAPHNGPLKGGFYGWRKQEKHARAALAALASPAVRDERTREVSDDDITRLIENAACEHGEMIDDARESGYYFSSERLHDFAKELLRTHQKVAAAGDDALRSRDRLFCEAVIATQHSEPHPNNGHMWLDVVEFLHYINVRRPESEQFNPALVATPESILAAEEGGGAVALSQFLLGLPQKWRTLAADIGHNGHMRSVWSSCAAELETQLANPFADARRAAHPSQAGVREVSAGAVEWPSIDDVCAAAMREDAEFSAWRNSVPDKHWVRLDLSALRVGYELGGAVMRRLFENDDRARQEVTS